MKCGCVALAVAMLSGAVVLGTAGLSSADQNYVPRGHAYGPDLQRLPPLNSRQDKIHAKADIYESEIRRRELEMRIQMERLRQHNDLDLIRPGRSYFPY